MLAGEDEIQVVLQTRVFLVALVRIVASTTEDASRGLPLTHYGHE